jgi:hypothetical protein
MALFVTGIEASPGKRRWTHTFVRQRTTERTLIAEGGLYKRLYEAQNVDPDLVYPTG